MTNSMQKWLLAAGLWMGLWPGPTYGQSPELDQAFDEESQGYKHATPF